MLTYERKFKWAGIFALCLVFTLAIIPIMRESETIEVPLSAAAQTVLPLGDGFAVLGANCLTAYDDSGNIRYFDYLSFDADTYATDSTSLAILSDALRVYGEAGLLYELIFDTIPQEFELLGDCLVTGTKGTDYSCEITLFYLGERIFTRYIADFSLTSIAMNEDGIFLLLDDDEGGKILGTDYAGQELFSQTIDADADDILSLNETICVVFTEKLVFFSAKSLETVEKELLFSAVTATYAGFLALGSQELLLIDEAGEIIASYPTPYGKKRLLINSATPAILYGDELIVFDDKLSEIYTLSGTAPKQAILYRNTAVLVWPYLAEIHRK